MSLVIKFLFTFVFGVLWWWVYSKVAPGGFTYLVILGSVLAVCVCCCRHRAANDDHDNQWNFQVYLQCIQRCWLNTLVLMVGLFFVGIFVVWWVTGVSPTASEFQQILYAAIGAPLCVRAICCAYED